MSEPDWIPVPNAPEQLDELLIDDLELIGDITHPLRGRIIHRLREPHSVAELAASLDVPTTRLYHHIKRLEEIGMISVVATRRAGVVTERQYRNTALDFRIDDKVITSTDAETFGRAISSLFDVARTEFQREVELGALLPGTVRGRATIGLLELDLADEHRGEFTGRLHALIDEYKGDGRAALPGNRWRLFLAGFPLTD
jgi:DNA-binding transcriptional ArsR family regulator